MWIPVLLSCLWGYVLSQDNVVNNFDGSRAQWGWQMSQTGPGTVGHYFVQLPEAVQQVRYIADGSGYHGAVAVTTSDQQHIHTTNFALGERAVELNAQIPNIYQNSASNRTQLNSNGNQQAQTPIDIYLLQQQYPQGQFLQILPNSPQNFLQISPVPNFYYTDNGPKQIYYSGNIDHSLNNNKENSGHKDKTTPLNSEGNDEIIETRENGPVVRVFKDHKCSNDENVNNQEYATNLQKTPDLVGDVPNYKERNIHGDFGARESGNKQIYQIESNYKIDPSDRSERFYYSTEISHPTTIKPISYSGHEGISRLVASTQDLISNEDLLRINHAAEKVVNSHTDDIIKPRRNPNARKLNYYNHVDIPRQRLTVTAKYGNIDDSERNQPLNIREQTHETTNEYRFASPIVVEDINYGDYKQKIVNNLMSTMVPYIENGYGIVDVRNNLNENNTYNEENKSGEDLVNITPRPVSQNYLTPITVALRLLNSNDTDLFNTVDDHETSNSEFVSSTVESPRRGKHHKTIVEIQKSIPVEITHINDVEYHEYLDEGRSNKDNPTGLMSSLYYKYIESLDSAKNNENTYHNNNQQNSNEESSNTDSNETSESNENVEAEVQAQASSDNRNSYTNYYDSQNKLIQPIIIEKQVPVPTYVDRFIEKRVPYPEPVEVLKQVPIDRPVPVPVHYQTIVEKPVEVTRYVDKPYPIEVLKPYPVEVRVPYPVEHKVYIDRPVHIPFPVEKVVEKQLIHPVPVPTPVGVPVGIQVPVEKEVLYPVPIEKPVPVAVPIEKPVPVEKIVEKEVPVPYPVEKKVPYPVRHEVKIPVPYPVEKRVPYPVEKIVEKPVTVTKYVEKHIKVPVPHPVRVEVPRPYPVERIVEKKVPYPVHIDRIVEKKVPVQVPYPVKTVVEKIVEKPVVFTKYIEKPYPVEKRVPYAVEKIVERKVPYPVHIPVEVKVPYPVERDQKHAHQSEPYRFEKAEPTTLYSYGITQEALSNVANYLRYQQEQYKQPIPNYVKSDIESYSTQHQAESQRNYQIQLANAQLLKNVQNATPVQTTRWGNQYASSYNYLNSTADNRHVTNNNVQDNSKYYGPPPLRNYIDQWEKNKEYTDRIRRTERTPKVISNLRIEYGFKPPLIPSTEVDINGIPINKKE